MRPYKYICTLSLSFSLLLMGCGNNESESNTETETIIEIEAVSAVDTTVSQEQLQENDSQLLQAEKNSPEKVRTTGYIEVSPQNKASISAFMGGYVKQISLLEGKQVAKGDLLVSLENPEYIELQQEYLEVVAQLGFLESDFERQETMLAENITSRKNFLKAESAYKTALARSNGLRQKLQMLNISPKAVEAGKITSEIPIYAPIDGKVSRVNVSRGMYIAPTQSILEIFNTDEMHVELSIFESDVMRIQEGQEIRFSVPEISGEEFKAEVYLVGRAIDEETRTVKVHAHFADSLTTRFAVGMFVDAEIDVR